MVSAGITGKSKEPHSHVSLAISWGCQPGALLSPPQAPLRMAAWASSPDGS